MMDDRDQHMIDHWGAHEGMFAGAAQADRAAGGAAQPAATQSKQPAPKHKPLGNKALGHAKALDQALAEHKHLLVGGKQVDPHVELLHVLTGLTRVAVRFTSLNADFKKQAHELGAAAADAATYAGLSDKALSESLKSVNAQHVVQGYTLMREAVADSRFACAVLAAAADANVNRADAEMLAVQITADGCFAAAGVLSGTAEVALGTALAIAVAQPMAAAVGRSLAGDAFDVATMAEDALISALMLGFKPAMAAKLTPACERLIAPRLEPLLENAAKLAKHAKYELSAAQQAKVTEFLVGWAVDKILANTQSTAQAFAHCATNMVKHYKDKPPNPAPSKVKVAVEFIEAFIKHFLTMQYVIHLLGVSAISMALGHAGVVLKAREGSSGQ